MFWRCSARRTRRRSERHTPLTVEYASAPLITVAIFDLDDTLYDCFGQRVPAAHRYAAEAMVRAGVPATVDEVFAARMRAFARNPQLEAIDAEVCREFGVHEAEALGRAARAAFFSAPVGELTLFPATLHVLRSLHGRGVRVFIVTFGHPETQRRKVTALGLDRESSVERIDYADTGNLVSKEDVFAAILRHTGAPAGQALVIGDRPNREIRAGKRLGMHTVRVRGGEFAALEPQSVAEQAEHEIPAIEKLLALPFHFGQ